MLQLRKGIVSTGVICLAVVSLLAVYTILGNAQAPSPRPLGVLPTPTCSFSVKSFCATEASIKQYVATNDFSDVLEDQIPISVVCSSASALQQYCQSGDSGAAVQLYQVKQQHMGLMTRNQYITFFMSYVQQHGSLKFVSTVQSGSDVLMSFANQSDAYTYTLLFTKEGSMWKASYPSVGMVQ